MVGTERYDEVRLRRRLETLDRASRASFAAACAERLWPLVERYALVSSVPADRVAQLRGALDAVWAGAMGQAADVAGAQHLAESMVPREDEKWVMEAGYGQNAIAAIAYAARTWLTDHPQAAVWAARQVYEAGDYGAQQELDDGVFSAAVEEELQNAPVVVAAVRAIADDLEAAGSETAETVRQRSQAGASAFAGLFP